MVLPLNAWPCNVLGKLGILIPEVKGGMFGIMYCGCSSKIQNCYQETECGI
jgi:hypothetical protein